MKAMMHSIAACLAVVLPQAPLAAEVALDISVSGADVRLFWPAMSQSHALERAPDPAGPWMPVTQIPAIAGDYKELFFSRSVPRYFFRLSYPLEAGPDLPDGTFTDTNGDGIDGELGTAVFVAPAGLDAAGCGLVPTNPCRTISFGITRAVANGRSGVYVQAGTYPEMVKLAGGIGVYGGFDNHWLRAPNDTPGHTVLVTGTPGTNEAIALKASDLTATTVAADLEIRAPNATGAVAGNGRSSYGIFVRASPVTLDRLVISAGTGGRGGNGGNGALGQPGGTGGLGGNAADDSQRGGNGGDGAHGGHSGAGGGGAGGGSVGVLRQFSATLNTKGVTYSGGTAGTGGSGGDSAVGSSYQGDPGSIQTSVTF